MSTPASDGIFPTSMQLAVETKDDVHFGELSAIRDSVNLLIEDIEVGRERDGLDPVYVRSDRGRRMNLKLVKARLEHLKINLDKKLQRFNLGS